MINKNFQRKPNKTHFYFFLIKLLINDILNIFKVINSTTPYNKNNIQVLKNLKDRLERFIEIDLIIIFA